MGPNPYAAPSAYGGPYGYGSGANHVSLRGDVLIVPKHGELPSVCMKCGAQENIVRRDMKLSWTPTWARLSVILCTMAGLIAVLVTTKRARLAMPLCAPCNARWSSALAAVIGAVVVLFAGLMSFGAFDSPAVGGVVFFVSLATFVATGVGFARPRMLQVNKIDDHVVELKGVHPVACRVLTGGG